MKTARKLLSLLLVLVMCLCMFTACGDNNNNDASSKKDDGDKTTSSTTKKPSGDGPISGLLGDLTQTEADPADDPYDAIARAWALTVEDAGASYLSMLDAIPTIMGGTATYELALDVDGQKIDLSAVVDPNKLKMSADVAIDVQGVNTEASLWLGDDIVVSVPDLLGNKAYGVKLSTVMNDLNNSWLLGMTGYDSAEDLLASLLEDNGLTESLGELEALLDQLTELEDALTASFTEAAEDFAENLAKELDKLDTKVTTANGNTVITTTVTADDAANVVLVALDFAEALYSDTLASLIPEDLGLDEARDDIDAWRDEPGELQVIHTLAASGKLKAFEIIFVDEDGEQEETINITFAEGDGFACEMFMEGESLFSFKALTGNVEGFEVVIPAEDATLRFERNTSSGDFALTGKTGGETMMELKGNLQYGSNKFALELDSMTMDGETTEFGYKISMKAGGSVKALPNYQNILKMSQNQIQSLLMDIQNSDLAQSLM